MSATWEMTCRFIAWFITCFVSMRLWQIVLRLRHDRDSVRSVLVSPLLSIRIWDQRRPATRRDWGHWIAEAAWTFPLAVAVYCFFPRWLSAQTDAWWIRGYLAVVPFLIFAKSLGTVMQLILMPCCGRLPPFIDQSYRSRSLAEFWGKRWNTWHGGWFWEAVFPWFRRRPALGLMMVFFLSGLWHELLIAVPLWNVFGESVFGMMTAYFMLQAVGLYLERRWLRKHPRARHLCTWLFVLAPIPLMLNRATLLVFHLVLP
ncbi:hypothetical protein Mal15_10930 [Stieleria maiorica]|uniref:Wax synthase domain-containing protein n=1 Tax=Stieleria maiorica TaxID=2795974 RepID=A0A5B9M783_9BACT|nr:hypothetical protein [Stieleria maiorica]QEF97058.1 hypothetical protein Mal15_10930 [Stieleria maiorica]